MGTKSKIFLFGFSCILVACQNSVQLIDVKKAEVDFEGTLTVDFEVMNKLKRNICISSAVLEKNNTMHSVLRLSPKNWRDIGDKEFGYIDEESQALTLLQPSETHKNSLNFYKRVKRERSGDNVLMGRIGFSGRYCNSADEKDFKVDFEIWSEKFPITYSE